MPLNPATASCDMLGVTFTLQGETRASQCTVLSPDVNGQPSGDTYIACPDALSAAPILRGIMFPYSDQTKALVSKGVLTQAQVDGAKIQIAGLVAMAKAAAQAQNTRSAI